LRDFGLIGDDLFDKKNLKQDISRIQLNVEEAIKATKEKKRHRSILCQTHLLTRDDG